MKLFSSSSYLILLPVRDSVKRSSQPIYPLFTY